MKSPFSPLREKTLRSFSEIRNTIKGNLYAFRGAYQEQFLESRPTSSYLNFFVGGVPAVAVLAWVATRSTSTLALALISVGACLMVMWNMAVFRIGWSASGEIDGGIFHINLLSKTPVAVIMLGKAVSYVAFTALTGLGAFLVILLVVHKLPFIANLPAFIISLLVAMFSMVCASFIFAPLAVIMGGRGGFFNAIMPFGIVFSGFLYPVSVLPGAFKVIARMLPTSYSMDGVIRSIQGNVSVWRIAGDWAIALAISLVYLIIAYYLFQVVEKRVRYTGVLSTF